MKPSAFKTSKPVLTCGAFCLLFLSSNLCAYADKKSAQDQVAVVPFTIEAQPFEKTPNRTDQDDEIRRLQEEAAKQAERSLKEHGLAGNIESAATAQAAKSPLVLSGVVHLAVSLPSRVYGMACYLHSGPFITVIETLQHPDGTVIATGTSTLGWKGCWWITAGKSSHIIPVDKVLADFVRKAVDRATRNVFKNVAAKTDIPPSSVPRAM